MNVRTLCLGILSMREASGYEIKKMIEEDVFGHFIEASYGSIYPALGRMTEEGLLSVRSEEQAGKPDKKVYTITPSGLSELAMALEVDPAKDKFRSEFLFQMLLGEMLPANHLALIYEAQIDYLREEIARIKQRGDESEQHDGMQFVSKYGIVSLSAGLNYLEENKQEFLGRLNKAKATKQ